MRSAISLTLIILAAAAGTIWLVAGPSAPRAVWIADGEEAPELFAERAAGSPYAVRLTLDRPAWVYAFAHNPQQGLLALFPTPDLDTDLENPLPAGTHRLPGTASTGVELDWLTRNVRAPADAILIVSEDRLPELEELIGAVRQVTNTVFPDRSMVHRLPEGMEDASELPPRATIPSELLRDAARQVAPPEEHVPGPVPGHPGVRATTLKFTVTEAPGADETLETMTERLQRGDKK